MVRYFGPMGFHNDEVSGPKSLNHRSRPDPGGEHANYAVITGVAAEDPGRSHNLHSSQDPIGGAIKTPTL